MELARYDAMCKAIQVCEAVDEVKKIRDKSMALEAYAKQSMNTEAERKACAVRLRAERRAGELLAPMERKQTKERSPGRKGISVHAEPILSEFQQAKKNAHISDTQAKRWQNLAKVDDGEFETALADPKKKPSTSGLIKKVNGSTSKMDDDALALWGRLRDFEQLNIEASDFEYLIGEMTDTMQADLSRIIPAMIGSLSALQEILDE